MCQATKILGNLHFFYCFFLGGSPLNCDKEKWYCIYTEQFQKNNEILIFCHNFVTPI